MAADRTYDRCSRWPARQRARAAARDRARPRGAARIRACSSIRRSTSGTRHRQRADQRVSNSCSEFMQSTTARAHGVAESDDVPPAGRTFDIASFAHAVDIVLRAALEIVVSRSSIRRRRSASQRSGVRPLGLGFANLGAYLMATAWPMTPSDGRATAAAITALMSVARTGVRPDRRALGAVRSLRREPRGAQQVMRIATIERRPTRCRSSSVDDRVAAAALETWDEAVALGSSMATATRR